ncbi:MAG: TolC family protein [Sulfuricurvum sp.]|uniref:TolC family protein n=1 Tax=Sulfuricurvum sp. TaxID=2025608 RepID=UPI00260B78BB|nr:TolC family protein [Sulfuricurvum sp.]MDD2829624.1 TolC family protein [Sulfuricurvum sp.]MDD4950556.1 TolC family protein [Sulfuricurvum sp.]
MKMSWGYSVILIPFLGYAISFNDLSEQAYTASGELIQSHGHLNAIGFEKASALAGEALSIETSGRKIHANTPADSGQQYGMMVDYTMKMPSLKSAQAYEFELQKKGTESEMSIQKGLIQVALKRFWLMYQLEQERNAVMSQKRDFSYKAYQIGEKKFKGGRLSQMELLRLESEYKNTLQEVALVMMEAEHAQHYLKESVMSQENVIVDDMNFEFIKTATLEERINNAPLLKSLNVRIEAIDAQISTLRHSTIESVSLGVGMTQEPTQNSLDFRLTVPLTLSSKNENKIAALMSERSALAHSQEVNKQKLHISVRGLVEHLQEREERIKVLSENEKSYETLFTIAQKGYEGGVIGQFEYLASKNAYYDARLRTLQVKQNYIEEMSAIEEKIGGIW